MARRVAAATAKAQFSALIAEVAHGGTPIIIERHGQPYVAIVDLEGLARIETPPRSPRPGGALALVGGWRDVGDDLIDALVADIYDRRAEEVPRAVDLAQ